MTIAHCPKCRERVSIPLGASRQARVRCPLCSEEYLLDDALQDLPPLLVLLSDPQSQSSGMLDKGPMVVPSFADSGQDSVPPLVTDEPEPSTEWNLEPSTAPAAAPAFNFEPGSAVSTTRSSTSRSSSALSRARPRRKEGSAMRMIVQTIGGGALGLIIAQLILWWMPGNWAKENRDPFGLAGTVAAYVPAIVPATLRESTSTAQADSPTVPPAVDFSRADTASNQAGKAESDASADRDTTIPDFKFGDNATTQPSDKTKTPDDPKTKRKADKGKQTLEEFPLPGLNEPTEAPPVLGGKEDPVVLPDLALDPAQSTASPDDGKIKKVEPATDAATIPVESPKEKTKDQKSNDVKTPLDQAKSKDQEKRTAAPEVAARLNDVETAQRAWDTAENPPRETKVGLITELFNKLAQLGETTTQVNNAKQRAEILSPVVQKLNSLAEQSDKMLPLSRLAVIRLKDDLDKGGLAVGVVTSHQMRGTFHETQLRLLGTEPVVTVVSPTDEISQLPANTNICVLGRWVSNPADNLTGYEGNAESVLLHGVHAIVAAK